MRLVRLNKSRVGWLSCPPVFRFSFFLSLRTAETGHRMWLTVFRPSTKRERFDASPPSKLAGRAGRSHFDDACWFLVFAKAWMREMGYDPEDKTTIQAMQKSAGPACSSLSTRDTNSPATWLWVPSSPFGDDPD
jgi:hypothetical protein